MRAKTLARSKHKREHKIISKKQNSTKSNGNSEQRRSTGSRLKQTKTRKSNSITRSKTLDNSESSVRLGEFADQIGLEWDEGQILSLNIRGFGSGKNFKIGDFRKLLRRENPDIVALQETKCNTVSSNWVNMLWGSNEFDFIQKEKVGLSGGMLLIWNTSVFIAEHSMINEFFIAVKGKWKGIDGDTFIVNVYGPHDDSNKVKLWSSLESLVGSFDAAWVLGGDFNEVRDQSERKNCVFVESRARRFNEFINRTRLVEVPLGGKRFTRIYDNGDKEIDFGPKPTKVFDEWLEAEGADEIVRKAWNINVGGRRPNCIFRNKLKEVKIALKEWSYRILTDSERDTWLDIRKKWLEKEKIKSGMAKQKACVKWNLEGDENTKYFHSILKRKYSKRNIHGLSINGEWCEDLIDIKEEVFLHFKKLFKKQDSSGM
ncbi:uncharacterized protein [Rutidosis leptorrhynchoides]|uniref:uncharacterized protein n=1 Tax=Rutidosis leptorrhynchoides TaxID=125765 RepID=UPI003A9A22CD